MNDDELLARVRKRIEDEALSQADVASACDLSQPHLSKVLSKKVKLARKTRAALVGWMGPKARIDAAGEESDWSAIVARLRTRDPVRANQIMQLLRIIDALTT